MKNADSLRKKSLFEIDTDKVNRIDLKYEAKEFSLAKGEDRKWLINPYGFKAKDEEVNKFISGMKELKAKSIVDDNGIDLKKYGLLNPRLTLASSLSDKKNITVLIGKKHLTKEEDYAKLDNSPVIYSIDSAYLRGADKVYNDFRDKKLLYLTGSDINEVELVKDKKKITAKKGVDGKYTVTEPVLPAGRKTAETPYSNLIESLLNFEAKTFADDSGKKFEKYGLKNPDFIITLSGMVNNEKQVKAKILIGNVANSGIYVKIDSSESVFIVSADILEKLKEIEQIQSTK